jgi:cell division protease FtsH
VNNKNTPPDSRPSSSQKTSEPSPSMLVARPWLVVAILAGLWIFTSLVGGMFNQLSRTNLAYTEFKQQLRDGNIQEVLFQGDRLDGKFKKEVKGGPEGNIPYQTFSTTIPSIKDEDLWPLLEQHNVQVKAESQDGSWWEILAIAWLPWLLILGLIVYANKKMQERMGGMGSQIFGFGQSRAKRYERSESDARFADVAGLENPKKDLQEIIHYLKDPSKFRKLGAELPKGVLLLGPPGTGKTLLARACAGEADVPFFSLSGSEFIEMLVGVGASRVRDLFDNAKKEAPAIIFIDELDSIGRARGTGLGGGHDEREQTLNQILSEMDGFNPHDAVVVMAATNRPDVLDAALTRPGRFDRQVTIDLPDRRARLQVLRIHTKKVPLAPQVDLENLAKRTVGLSGADLKNIVNEAALLAGRKEKHQVGPEDFDQARDKVLMGAERDDIITDEEKRIVAYHEGGHALIAKLMPHADPLRKVSIIPRGRALGATEQIPAEDRHNLSYSYLRDRLAIMLGGRVAEKLTFEEYTTGAANDLKEATKLARRMICQWGMSERLGPFTCQIGEEHVFLGREISQEKDHSEHTARIIDEETQSLVVEIEGIVKEKLIDHRSELEALAEALLEQETLDDHEVDQILHKFAVPEEVS